MGEGSCRRVPGETVHPPGRGTVGEACEAYLADFIKRGGKAVTYTRDTIERVIRPELGHLRLVDLTPAHVRRWLQNIAGRGRGLRSPRGQETTRLAAPTAPDDVRARRATANRNYTVLRAALNHAYREGMVATDDAWRRVRPFQKVDEARVRYLSAPEASRLVVACPPELRQLVRAALLTGARFGELAALRVADFNADTQQIRIAPAKSGRARHVPLNAEGVTFFASIAAGRPGDALLLTRDNGKAWHRHAYLPAIANACTEAKIAPACTLHELRHTYASLLAQAGADLLTISKLLGHSDTALRRATTRTCATGRLPMPCKPNCRALARCPRARARW